MAVVVSLFIGGLKLQLPIRRRALAADVYAAAGQRGRGGWTWYTGSASWMYRVGREAILGFDERSDTLHITPVVPTTWPSFRIEYRHGKSLYVIDASPSTTGQTRVWLDGRELEGGGIPLNDEHVRHQVVVHFDPKAAP